jgi:RNA polymerase sigma-70 factor (ECF subfamily)
MLSYPAVDLERLQRLHEEVVRRYAIDPSRVSRERLARVDQPTGEVPAALDLLADAYLALACAEGDEAALRAFESAFGGELDRAIAKSPELGLTAQDFRQLFHERFFVATAGEPPRIASYAGRGALRSWVRVSAARLLVDQARKPHQPEPRPDEELARLLPTTGDPEAQYLRRAYAEKLPAAFAQALQRLSVRQRNLLRQRHLHELGGTELAQMYGVHRATIFVWLDAARKDLLGHLREVLRVELGGQELESMVALLGSQLEVSVRRLLDSRLEDDPDRGG